MKPRDKPFPYGQRDAEQRTYDEAIAEIQYADRLGFNTAWVVEHHFREGRSACPCNEAVLGGLALSTKQIRLGFGVTLTPFGFRSPSAVGREGRHSRRPEPRQSGVGHRTLHAHGADRIRCADR